jgi:transposase-like protein
LKKFDRNVKMRTISELQREKIIELVSEGARIADICKQFSISPMLLRIMRQDDALFGQKFDLAQKVFAELRVEELQTIADQAVTPTDATVASIKSKNIQWLAGKHDREKYGDKVDVAVNATLDITRALDAANARLGPVLDQTNIAKHQVPELIAEFTELETGLKPVENSTPRARKANSFEEIL